MKYLIRKTPAGGFTFSEMPGFTNPEKIIGSAKIFVGDTAPTNEQMAALFIPQTPSPIALAEAHIAKSFSTLILMDGLKRIMAATAAGTIASIPKTIAVATWVETVKQTALAGSTNFPAVPFTVAEVLSE